jgi:hypothetical protein
VGSVECEAANIKDGQVLIPQELLEDCGEKNNKDVYQSNGDPIVKPVFSLCLLTKFTRQ